MNASCTSLMANYNSTCTTTRSTIDVLFSGQYKNIVVFMLIYDARKANPCSSSTAPVPSLPCSSDDHE